MTAANSKVVFTWDQVPVATGYVVYGRTDPVTQLATIGSGSTLTYTDLGTASGSGVPAESINTSGVHYVSLGALDITVGYSKRRQTESLGFSTL